ncbi:MAG: alkaline phosphatase family protein [Sphingomicrobium sp.]
MSRLSRLALLGLFIPSLALAQPATPPKLVIVLVVDQLSGGLWNEYRGQWSGGFARLAGGTVYANGFQSHATTETCPGHAAISTGVRPGRNGIVANEWVDRAAPRADKRVYCAEDERIAGSTSNDYRLSAAHLRVPTIGERLKRASPGSRVIGISGKDRSAAMLAGQGADQLLYRKGKAFVASSAGSAPPSLAPFNAAMAAQVAAAQPTLEPTPFCAAKARPIAVPDHAPVGAGAFARKAGDWNAYRASPEFDGATLALAAAAIRDLRLGQSGATDLLAIGLSATDAVGHALGSEGQEMCLNLLSLDRDLGDFFSQLDRWGIDYAVALSSDHGVADLPERARLNGDPQAQRIDVDLTPEKVSAAVRAKTGLKGPILYPFGTVGDLYLAAELVRADRDRALAAVISEYRAHPQVEAVFAKAEVAAASMPSGDPRRWSLIERVRVNFDPERSGDLYVILKDHVTPIGHVESSVATHGSAWDHDRHVPIIFWRKSALPAAPIEAVETVDIAPTLAAMLRLPIAAGDYDGRCLNGAAGVVCPTR